LLNIKGKGKKLSGKNRACIVYSGTTGERFLSTYRLKLPVLVLLGFLGCIGLGTCVQVTQLDAKVALQLASMTLEEKVGQLFIIGGNWQDPAAFKQFALYHFGNAYLGTYDVGEKTPAEVSQLTDKLQALALKYNQGIPLFIFTDQEGGLVNRLKKGFITFPCQEEMSRQPRTAMEQAARTTARQLAAVGVNVNLAPVIDIYSNPLSHIAKHRRSFSSDPEIVTSAAGIYISAFRREQVLACVKHFPNDGDIADDPHNILPVNRKSKKELLATSLTPYRQLINKGQLQMLMVSHVLVPALEPDPTLPASLSRHVIADFIRRELNYQGVIVIDEMNMKALGGGKHPNVQEIVKASKSALEAGIDLLFFTGPERLHIAAYHALVKAFAEGTLPAQRLNESVSRVLKLKYRSLKSKTAASPVP
jgi:beta-N-acetylhexosaminidase